MRLDIDSYHNLARPFFGVTLLTPRERFLTDVTFFSCGNLVATDVKFSNQKMDRNPRRITEFDTEYLLIETYRRGSTRGISDGQHMTLVNHDIIHIMDWSRSYVGLTNNAEGIGVHIPHSELGYDPSRHPPYLALSANAGRGRLLALSLELLVEELKGGESGEAERLASAVVSLVRTCLLGEQDWERNPAEDASRRLLIESYIRRNILADGLNADRICRDLGMSRATLYRAFGSGGIDHFVRGERLDRCFSELVGCPARHGAVRQVAERWGFYDAGHFRRSFKARFGFPPSDCLGEATAYSEHCAANLIDHPIAEFWRNRRNLRETARSVHTTADDDLTPSVLVEPT